MGFGVWIVGCGLLVVTDVLWLVEEGSWNFAGNLSDTKHVCPAPSLIKNRSGAFNL